MLLVRSQSVCLPENRYCETPGIRNSNLEGNIYRCFDGTSSSVPRVFGNARVDDGGNFTKKKNNGNGNNGIAILRIETEVGIIDINNRCD